MKKLLLILFIVSPLALAQNFLPACSTEEENTIEYDNEVQQVSDFCINGLKLDSIAACHSYLETMKDKDLKERYIAFVQLRISQLCGK